MKKKQLQQLFEQYCQQCNVATSRSHFEDDKYVMAIPETIYLAQSDPRAGNNWAIMKNGDNGTVSVLYGYVPAAQMVGYLEAKMEAVK